MNLDHLRGQHYGVKHLLSPKSGTLIEALQTELELDSDFIHKLLNFGSIYVNGSRCMKNMQIHAGTYIRVHQNPRRFPTENFDLNKSLVFENEDLVVIDKPAGLPVHPTVDNIEENLAFLLSQSLRREIFVTHRLDVATSGLLVYAKSKKSQTQINSFFSESKVKKLYRCLVSGDFENTAIPMGEISHWMEPSPRAPKVVSPVERSGWALCKLKIIDSEKFRPPWNSGDLHEVQIELLTGRTHQIRAQMANLGYPIFGDTAYGSPHRWEKYEKIGLQCSYLSLPNPAQPELFSQNLSFRLYHRPWS